MPTPPAGPNPRRPATVADLVRRAAAALDRRSRAKLLNALARRSRKGEAAADVFRQLVAVGPTGPRLALDFFARLSGPIAPELTGPALMLLKHKAGPVPVRIAAAGNLLAAVPDTPDGVRPVLAALTGKLPRTAALERLIRLQSRVRRCASLDAAVATAESALRLKCPKCPAQLTRPALIQHLWEKHRLIWEQGKARTPQARLERTMDRGAKAAAEPNPARVDAAFAETALYFPDVPPREVFQALAARGSALPTQLQPLLDRAADDRSGLCPVCLSALPDPIPDVPPPAPVGGGRLAAEGYAVDVTDGLLGRTVRLTDPYGVATAAARRIAPRTLAVLVAGPVLLAGAAAGCFLAPRLAAPAAGALTAAGWLAYAAVRLTRPALPASADEAVDRAWADVVPGIGRKPPAVRFLTRLCRTSLGAGTPVERTPAVWELVEQAAVLADRGGVHLQLLATARVLQATDGAAAGRERVAGLLTVFEPFVRGELPLAYAEAAAETLLAAAALPAGDGGRLAVRLVGAAFEAGYKSSDLAAVARFAPYVRHVIGDPTEGHLRTLHAVWRGRHQRRWAEAAGPAETVFELAERSPAAAKRVLTAHPDAVLVADVGDVAEGELGPVLVTAGGVVAGGATVADPDAPVQVSANGRELVFGTHRIAADRKLPSRLAAVLKGWLKYRGRVLLPAADQPEARPAGPTRAAGVLAPLAVGCPLCATVSVVRAGQLGVRWDELTAGRA